MSIDEFNNDVLTTLLEKISAENKTFILLGDFNIDTDREVSNCFDIINSFSLLPRIILSTRVTSSSSTLIDNIFCNSSDNNSVSGNIISCISDHFPQFLILSIPLLIDNDSPIRNWKVFNECLSE